MSGDCPVSCGQCCADYWRDVDALRELAPDSLECPHEGAAGCRLSREQRPVECRAFLCETADLVVSRRITLVEGTRRKTLCVMYGGVP